MKITAFRKGRVVNSYDFQIHDADSKHAHVWAQIQLHVGEADRVEMPLPLETVRANGYDHTHRIWTEHGTYLGISGVTTLVTAEEQV